MALRLHRIVRLVELVSPAALGKQSDNWLRVHESLTSYRAEMLWLNDRAHQMDAPGPLERDVTDVIRDNFAPKKRGRKPILAKSSGNRSYNFVSDVCHIK